MWSIRRRVALSSCLALTPLVGAPGCGEGDLRVSAALPRGDVQLSTDTRGVTHVYASTDEDAFYGSGYAMARDRLFQMELLRRRATGRLAEVLGDEKRKDDVVSRVMGFSRLGRRDVSRMQAERPVDAALLDAWAKGINARLAEIRRGSAPVPYGLRDVPGELGFVPEDWTAADGATIGKLLAFGLSSTLESEILSTAVARLAPEFASRYPLSVPAFPADPLARGIATSNLAHVPASAGPPGPALAVPPGLDRVRFTPLVDGGTSNNWAVTREHSYNGRPLLAGDPHQALTSPTRLYPMHLSSTRGGGAFDVVGFAFVGTPGVQLGHNARVAWTATTSFADVMDAWGVDTDALEENVLLPDGVAPIVTRHETVRVRLADGTFTEVHVAVREVPGFGVLLPDEALPLPRALLTKHQAVLFAWTGFAPTVEGSAYLAMDRATSVGEWEAAVDLIEVGAQNFVGADARDVSYRVSARVPDRGPPSAHPMPVRILEAEEAAGTFWSGKVLPLADLPRLRNPARGFLATANSDPFGFTFDGDVSNDPFYFGSFFANGMRTRRIEDALGALLATGKPLTHADMEALQRDRHSIMADVLVPKLHDAVAAVASDASLSLYAERDDLFALEKRLAAWDRSMDPDSADALLFVLFEWHAARRAIEPRLGTLLFDAIAEKSPPYLVGALRNVVDGRVAKAAEFLPEGGLPGLLLASLEDAELALITLYGTPSLEGRRLSQLTKASFPTTFGGRLVVPKDGLGGSMDTIDVSPASPFEKKGDALALRDELTVVERSLYRMVVSFDPDGTPRATCNFARGTSEDPDDRHFGDQHATWLSGDHPPLWFREKEVLAHEERRVVLPAGAPR